MRSLMLCITNQVWSKCARKTPRKRLPPSRAFLHFGRAAHESPEFADLLSGMSSGGDVKCCMPEPLF
jgi:hypothetical protein